MKNNVNSQPLEIDPSLVPKSVLVMPIAVNSWVYERLLPKMRELYGTRFVIFAPRSRHDHIFTNWCSPQDKIIVTEDIDNSCSSGSTISESAETLKAQDFEKQYGLNYFQDIIQLDRSWSAAFLGRSPWSPFGKLKTPYLGNMTKKINNYIRLAEDVFRDENIDLLLMWPLDALSASFVSVAEKHGIPVSYPYVSSRKSLLYWSSGDYCDDSQHRLAFESTPECEPLSIVDVVPPASVTSEIYQMDQKHSLVSFVKTVAWKAFHRLEFFYLDLRRLDFQKKSRINFFDDLVQQAYRYYFYKQIGAISERNTDVLSEKPFVYFSLSLEPEFSVQARSKEFNDQATIVKQIAMSLPLGYDLIIKEHVLLGRRHLSFYKDLLKFPNVKMAHPSVRGIDLAAKSCMVATLAGSVTLEATLLGKPVIEFSTHSTFSFLPNVTTVTSFHGFPKLLADILYGNNKGLEDQTRRVGARALKAVESISFNGAGSPIFGGNKIEIDDDGVLHMTKLLISLFKSKNAGLSEKYSTFLKSGGCH